MNEKIDDGSLAFLNIAADQELKRFNCDLIRMADLINKEFWILDYFDDIKTKNGDELRCRMSSYNGWLKYCNSQQLTNKINKIANYEIIK